LVWSDPILIYPIGWPLTFADLNPERPNLILNATDATEQYRNYPNFGEVFTFTKEDFNNHLKSDINKYSVARGVMASAAFPAVFSYTTLADFNNDQDQRFHHVFDGGNADNLGLTSLKKVIQETNDRYKHYIVILIDAFIKPLGKDSTKPDPRTGSVISSTQIS